MIKYGKMWIKKCSPEDVVVILQDMEFGWRVKDVKIVKRMWETGATFEEICGIIKRDTDEIFLLLLHLSRSKIIKKRKGGILKK